MCVLGRGRKVAGVHRIERVVGAKLQAVRIEVDGALAVLEGLPEVANVEVGEREIVMAGEV